MSFSPDTLVCDVGDTINFILGASHNAVEVDSITFIIGGNSSNGGFNLVLVLVVNLFLHQLKLIIMYVNHMLKQVWWE